MRNTIIDNLRGICMLGVIGIHIGSLALAPNNFILYLLLEILSRYSVPSFFFISGYGLACTDKGLLSGSRLNYIDFMKKRLRGAGLPYLSWSLFYMLYFWLILHRASSAGIRCMWPMCYSSAWAATICILWSSCCGFMQAIRSGANFCV